MSTRRQTRKIHKQYEEIERLRSMLRRAGINPDAKKEEEEEKQADE